MAVRSIIGPPVPGTRPGLHAQTLISTGQPDLDRILGGGLPLGSVFCILEDSLSQHHNTLLRYFIAEGLACGHQVFCASDNQEATTLSENLPQTVQPRSQPDEVAKLDEDNDSGLKIAWQYRRYLQDKQKVSTQQARKKSSAFQRKDGKSSAPKNDGIKDWCHEFDIARPLKDGAATQNLVSSLASITDMWNTYSGGSTGSQSQSSNSDPSLY